MCVFVFKNENLKESQNKIVKERMHKNLLVFVNEENEAKTIFSFQNSKNSNVEWKVRCHLRIRWNLNNQCYLVNYLLFITNIFKFVWLSCLKKWHHCFKGRSFCDDTYMCDSCGGGGQNLSKIAWRNKWTITNRNLTNWTQTFLIKFYLSCQNLGFAAIYTWCSFLPFNFFLEETLW